MNQSNVVFVNGEARPLPENPFSIIQLLTELDLSNKRLAVEVNLNIVPRSQFTDYFLQAGDKVEIIHAIGGG